MQFPELTDETFNVAPTPEPLHIRNARMVLDNPRSTKRQRELAWKFLKPLKLKPQYTMPDDPALKAFFERLQRTSSFRKAAMSQGQYRLGMMFYSAGWVDGVKHLETEMVEHLIVRDMASRDPLLVEENEPAEIPMPESLVG